MTQISQFFPVWDQLTPGQQQQLSEAAVLRSLPKGSVLHGGVDQCTGLLLIHSGQLRAYALSDQGRQITLYRLFERDICLMSASCMMRSLQFDVTIQAEKDTQVTIIPSQVYKQVMEQSAPLANYTNEIMASRFTDVMWLMEQVMWKSLDRRLAEFLLEESALENTLQLRITHEAIGEHLGSAREVITKMLRYFQSEGMVKLSRGMVELTAPDKLEELRDRS